MDFGQIDDFLGTGGNYVKIKEGETYQFTLKGIEPRQGKFGNSLEYIVIDSSGSEVKFSSASKRLWIDFKQEGIKLGDTFTLKKTGVGTSTRFFVKKSDGSNVNNNDETPPMPKDEEINLDDLPF